jgi:hypothetical protein
MGGEYLPDQQENEIEIARVTIASTTSDVTSVYACRNKDDIHYRAVDEYEGDTLSDQTTCSSKLPLTLGELADFFLGAWDLIGVLDMNFEDNRYPADEVRSFFERRLQAVFHPCPGDRVYRQGQRLGPLRVNRRQGLARRHQRPPSRRPVRAARQSIAGQPL